MLDTACVSCLLLKMTLFASQRPMTSGCGAEREEGACLAGSLERRDRSTQLFVLGSLASSHAGRGWFSARGRRTPTLMDWRRNIDFLDDSTRGVCSTVTPEASLLLWREKWDAATECACVCQDHRGYELAGMRTSFP